MGHDVNLTSEVSYRGREADTVSSTDLFGSFLWLSCIRHPEIVNTALSLGVGLTATMNLRQGNLPARVVIKPESIFSLLYACLDHTRELLSMPTRCDAQEITNIADLRFVAGAHLLPPNV